MTTDFRTLCAELTEFVARLTKHYYEPAELLTRARAALADEPAAPAPTVMEIIELSEEVEAAGLGHVDFARAVLARWGRQPAPPADGEVAELVEWLRETGDTIQPSHLAEHQRYKRAAELLERQVMVPVAVSVRLPGPEDCDAEGKCWWGRDESDDWYADWTLATHKAVAEFCGFSPQTVWIPAHALPLPEVGE